MCMFMFMSGMGWDDETRFTAHEKRIAQMLSAHHRVVRNFEFILMKWYVYKGSICNLSNTSISTEHHNNKYSIDLSATACI